MIPPPAHITSCHPHHAGTPLLAAPAPAAIVAWHASPGAAASVLPVSYLLEDIDYDTSYHPWNAIYTLTLRAYHGTLLLGSAAPQRGYLGGVNELTVTAPFKALVSLLSSFW